VVLLEKRQRLFLTERVREQVVPLLRGEPDSRWPGNSYTFDDDDPHTKEEAMLEVGRDPEFPRGGERTIPPRYRSHG